MRLRLPLGQRPRKCVRTEDRRQEGTGPRLGREAGVAAWTAFTLYSTPRRSATPRMFAA